MQVTLACAGGEIAEHLTHKAGVVNDAKTERAPLIAAG
jgi:hypothetical protein